MKYVVLSLALFYEISAFSAQTPQLEPVCGQPLLTETPKVARTTLELFVQAIKSDRPNLNAIHDLIVSSDNFIDLVDSDNKSALHYAAFYGYLPAVKKIHEKIKTRWRKKRLLELRTSSKDQMPIDFAILGGHLEVVKYLIEVCEVQWGEIQLRIAIAGKKLDVTKYLKNRLGKLWAWDIEVLEIASENETSGEILFYFGKTIDLVWLSSKEVNYYIPVKDFLNKILESINYLRPIN